MLLGPAAPLLYLPNKLAWTCVAAPKAKLWAREGQGLGELLLHLVSLETCAMP